MILLEENRIPAWIPIIIITRELVISGYRLKTVTQMLAIILALVDINSFGDIFVKQMDVIPFSLNLLVTLLMIICVIATLFSGYEYLKGGKDILKDVK